ncbi:hypothetical protein [Mesobacillus maritimus]|uniref:DUF4352 domain-containing protein n=1 Tax=Mesobacillus maritimus TaxID=1643336 RepID=A0ABS7KAS4_9BACI|nr:hypothetical protein [Mesobacillus maritimus]MBY0099373.1 hypothetical protein [Mesobacillus maritimus]
MKKSILLFAAIVMVVSLVACGESEKPVSTKAEESVNEEAGTDNQASTDSEVEIEKEVDGNAESEEEADVFEVSSDKNEEVKSSGNLFDKDKVFEYDNGSIVMKLTKAEFTTKFGASNADPEDTWANNQINSDSEIYFHLNGSIQNDRTDSLSFGNSLGAINFSLLYDDKHEFQNTSTAEEENGTKLGASSIDALSEGTIHVYFQVPKTVAESDKPLVLTVNMLGEPFEIKIR